MIEPASCDDVSATPLDRRPFRVVAVDDETGHRRHLEELVTPIFTVVQTYATVEDLLAAQPSADVVLLDLWIRTGVRPLRGIAAVQALDSLGYRVLLHSMDERPYVLAKLISAGALGFISKAASDEDLVEAIRKVASGEAHILTTTLAGFADHMHHLGLLKLTDAETAVLRARAQGLPVKTIAATTHYSEKAVERHTTNVNHKVKHLLRHIEIDGLSPDTDRPAAHLIARHLGLGPDDLL